VLASVVLAGCTTAAEPAPPASTGASTAIPFGAPAGASSTDFDVDGLDPCAPFASPLWLDAAAAEVPPARQAVPEPAGGCRWRGPGMTSTLAVESGRSLQEYSVDPAYQPGDRGREGNSYWMTRQTDATRRCEAFLAAGPAQPDRVVHLFVETEEAEAPLHGGGDGHACVFVRSLLLATSSVLEPIPTTS
jgi:hypothetical protein